MNENEENEMIVITPNPETIPCKNCVFGIILGYMKKTCEKYKEKPDGIYYHGEQCPFMRQSGSEDGI